MKVELIYDPVKPETMVCIDGQMTDKADIYGFLYPVRNCLLQTWLLPSGSWRGLAWQLRELSRGEQIDLLFSGRPEDFEDVRGALAGMEQLTLGFARTDPLQGYDSLFAQMDEKIALLLDEPVKQSEKKTLCDLFPETAEAVHEVMRAAPTPWVREISSEAELAAADQQALCCCMVSGDYLDSYEKLEKLNFLTRSMRRSQDMICCCLDDAGKRADFAHYAAQYDNMKIRFDTAEKSLPVLERKYGVPYTLREKYRRYGRILEILTQCYRQRDAIEARRTALAKEKNRTVEQTRQLERSKIILNWFDRKKPYLSALNELVTTGTPAEIQRRE